MDKFYCSGCGQGFSIYEVDLWPIGYLCGPCLDRIETALENEDLGKPIKEEIGDNNDDF